MNAATSSPLSLLSMITTTRDLFSGVKIVASSVNELRDETPDSLHYEFLC